MSNSIKTLAKGANWFFIGILISKLLGYFYRLIVARIGVSEYGVISLGILIVIIFPTIALMGIEFGILRYTAFYRAKKNEEKTRGSIISALLISGVGSVILFIILLLSSKLIARTFFGDESLYYIIQILAISLPFYVISKIFLNSIKAFEKIKYAIYSENIIGNILKVLSVLVLVYIFSMNIAGAAIAHVISIISVAVFSFYFFTKYIFNIFSKNFTLITGKMFSYSWPLMIGTLSDISLIGIDSFMIGYLLKDTIKLGIYNAAVPTAMLMLMGNLAILSLFTPVMSGLLANHKDQAMNKAYVSVTKWTFLFNFPLFLIMFFFSRDILRILFGNVYEAGGIILSVLVVGYFIYSILFASRNVLEIFKKTKLVMVNTLLVSILNIVLNYFLILRHGIIGAAISTSISLTLLGVLYLIEAWVIKGVNPIEKSYVKLTLVNIVCFFLVYKILNLLLNKTILYFILFGLMFGVLYLVLLLKLKCFSEEELDMIGSLKRKIFKF